MEFKLQLAMRATFPRNKLKLELNALAFRLLESGAPFGKRKPHWASGILHLRFSIPWQEEPWLSLPAGREMENCEWRMPTTQHPHVAGIAHTLQITSRVVPACERLSSLKPSGRRQAALPRPHRLCDHLSVPGLC
jgi:hypothetical protein